MVARDSLGRMVPRHDLEAEVHANDLRESGCRANVRCDCPQRSDDCCEELPTQSPVDRCQASGSAMFGHAEADIRSVHDKQNRFRTDRMSRRKSESFDAGLELCSDTRRGQIVGNRCGRDDIGDENRNDNRGHDHGGYTNLRNQSRRVSLRRDIGLTRELRSSRKTPTRIELLVRLGETLFYPVGLVDWERADGRGEPPKIQRLKEMGLEFE